MNEKCPACGRLIVWSIRPPRVPLDCKCACCHGMKDAPPKDRCDHRIYDSDESCPICGPA